MTDRDENFPITHHSVGGYPERDNSAYWVVCHPSGTKRWCWTSEYRDRIIENFKEAHEAIRGLDTAVVSERIGFEIALMAVSNKSGFMGSKLDENGKGGL